MIDFFLFWADVSYCLGNVIHRLIIRAWTNAIYWILDHGTLKGQFYPSF
jgi:hypothetical protein